MSRAFLRRLTKSRVGVAVCIGLIVFGAVTALLPRHAESRPTPAPVPNAIAGGGATNVDRQKLATPLVAAQQTAAQQVAVRFVAACDTTGPAQPKGDVATEAALAPGLVLPQDVVRPAAWQ